MAFPGDPRARYRYRMLKLAKLVRLWDGLARARAAERSLSPFASLLGSPGSPGWDLLALRSEGTGWLSVKHTVPSGAVRSRPEPLVGSRNRPEPSEPSEPSGAG
uniref:Uncharacterized protein n=1 Tax=Anopheles atroparvus TaxID=41427 RepID=A0A182IVS0_ANOAO